MPQTFEIAFWDRQIYPISFIIPAMTTQISLASYLDATYLKLDSSAETTKNLCKDALAYNVAAICIYSSYITLAKECLAGSAVKIATVCGFASGSTPTSSKMAEIEAAKDAGADEVDIVMNHSLFRDGDITYTERELKALAERTRSLGMESKVIVETCFLDKVQKETVLKLCEDAGADFIKTSTGFGTQGAQLEDIKLWNSLRKNIKIKASGGIKTQRDAEAMVAAGADRLGVSAAVNILEGKG